MNIHTYPAPPLPHLIITGCAAPAERIEAVDGVGSVVAYQGALVVLCADGADCAAIAAEIERLNEEEATP